MATAGSVVLELLAKTGSFDTDVQRSTKAAEKRLKELEQTAKTIGIAVGASLVAAAGSLAVFFKSTVDGMDALNDVADATGASIENISALESVALRTGGSIDTVAGILVKFNNVLKEADGKNGASRALELLGLSAEELKRIDPAEALRQTAVALSGFADDANKARIVQELFGKSVQEAAPYLKDLAEQGQLNATVTTAQAEAAEAFNKNIFELQTNITNLARELAGPLVDSLNEVVKLFKDGRAAGKSFLDIGLDNYWKNVRQFYGMKESGPGGATGSFGDPVEIAGPPSSLRSVGQLPPEPKKPKKAAAEKKNDYEQTLESLTRQLERTKDLTAAEQLLADIQGGRIKSLTASQRVRLEGLAAEIDAIDAMEEAEKQREESQKRLNTSQKEFRDYVDELRSQTRSPFETYLAGLQELRERLELGIIDTELFSQATKKLGDDFVASGDKAKEATDEFDEYAKQAQRNIQDALGDTLEDALSGNFDNIGKMWLQLIQRMAAQALAAQLNKQLFGDGQGSNGALGELFKAGAAYFTGQSANGSAATGMDYVPYDGFKAVLHKGERVMTAADNRLFDGQAKGGGDTFTWGPTYVGSNVSLPEVDALVTARNRELEAKFIRSRKQSTAA